MTDMRGTAIDQQGLAQTQSHIGGAGAAVSVGVVLGVALVDFVVENTRSVRIDIISANGRTP